MSDNTPLSNLVSVADRTVSDGEVLDPDAQNVQEADVDARIAALNSAIRDEASNRAGTGAASDNNVEGQIKCNTTTDPAKLYADLDGAGADTQIITTDDSASATAEGISELATIAEIDTGTDAGRVITPAGLAGSALQTAADGALLKSTFDANSLVIAVSDNTPVVQAVAASEFVGRKAAGNVGAMSVAEALAVLGVEAGADVTDATNVNAAGAVMEADYDAQTILMAAADDTPAAVTMGASTFAGRKAAGNVGAMSVAEALAVLGVEAGADVTDATNVNAAGATMNADTTMAGNGYFLDEDTLSSDDATKVASQQSIKAFAGGLATKVVDIGDWDMSAGTGTTTKAVAHGLTLANIRTIQGMIRDDAGTTQVAIPDGPSSASSGIMQVWVQSITANVNLVRLTGGDQDGATYNDTGYNRGWIVIRYVP